jgi:hypothetical protein
MGALRPMKEHCTNAGGPTMSIDLIQPGVILDFEFAPFTARVSFQPDQRLRLEIVAGDNKGFSDLVAYEVSTIRDDVIVLSWREEIGTTVVHVLDFRARQTYALVTPARGGFLRLQGTIKEVADATPARAEPKS